MLTARFLDGSNITLNDLVVNGVSVWEEQPYDYYVSTKGNDNNDGLTPDTAFATLSPLSNVNNGDRIFVEGGEYDISSTTTLTKGVTIESSEDNPATFNMVANNTFILSFNLANETNAEIFLNNINFKCTLSSGNRYLVFANIGSNTMNVNNCTFHNSYRQYDTGALDCRMNNGGLFVKNSAFTNNNGYGYGHSVASCRARGEYGILRVYNSIFNNPSGSNMVYGGTKGRAICAENGNNSCNIDARGKCNKFLGEGDTTYNYTEETCDK